VWRAPSVDGRGIHCQNLHPRDPAQKWHPHKPLPGAAPRGHLRVIGILSARARALANETPQAKASREREEALKAQRNGGRQTRAGGRPGADMWIRTMARLRASPPSHGQKRRVDPKVGIGSGKPGPFEMASKRRWPSVSTKHKQKERG
jgi:hypothetical protein